MPFDAGIPEETLADMIERAAAMIATRTAWCQGKLSDGDGRYCAVGAFAAVVFGGRRYLATMAWNSLAEGVRYESWPPPELEPAMRVFRRGVIYLNEAAAEWGYKNIMMLNDRQRWLAYRQHRLVLEVMRDAAEMVRRVEQPLAVATMSS
jgi:hypothetical protein